MPSTQSKDSNGQYYLSPNPSNERRQQLWGVPVYTTGHLGNTVLLVDASELLGGRRVAIRLEMSREYAFDQDATMIRVVGRYDVAVGNSGAVQRINTNVA